MKKYQSIVFKTILTGLVVSLQACGSDPAPAAAVPVAAPPVAPVAAYGAVPANDYYAVNQIPQLQARYGNVVLVQALTLSGGLTLAAGPHSWAEVYSFVYAIVTRSTNCLQTQQASPQIQQLGPWAYMNYGCFYGQIPTPDYNNMTMTGVNFEYYPSQMPVANFYMIFDSIVNSNRGIYYQSYGNQYPGWYNVPNNYIYASGGYNGNSVFGGVNYSGGRLNVSLGGWYGF